MTCSECGKKGKAKNLCRLHYDRVMYPRRKERKQKSWRAWAKTLKGQFVTSKNKAEQLGQEWTLTYEQYGLLRSKPCFYCEGPLPITSRGLDRVDNHKGYILDNVVPCCYGCNNFKSDVLSAHETKRLVQILTELRGQNPWTYGQASK